RSPTAPLSLHDALPISLERRYIHPGALTPGLQALFGQLYTFGAFQQGPLERLSLHDILQEQFPFHLERIVVGHLLRHLLPGIEIDRKSTRLNSSHVSIS